MPACGSGGDGVEVEDVAVRQRRRGNIMGMIHRFRLSLRERIVVLMAIDREEVSYGIRKSVELSSTLERCGPFDGLC
jgi:hypothetical protein